MVREEKPMWIVSIWGEQLGEFNKLSDAEIFANGYAQGKGFTESWASIETLAEKFNLCVWYKG